MNKTELKAKKEKWESMWPTDLRDKLSGMISKLITAPNEHHKLVEVCCSFRDADDESAVDFVFYIKNDFGTRSLFSTLSMIRLNITDQYVLDYTIRYLPNPPYPG